MRGHQRQHIWHGQPTGQLVLGSGRTAGGKQCIWFSIWFSLGLQSSSKHVPIVARI